jgi:hypothetical protein
MSIKIKQQKPTMVFPIKPNVVIWTSSIKSIYFHLHITTTFNNNMTCNKHSHHHKGQELKSLGYKICIESLTPYPHSMLFIVTWLDIKAKYHSF